MNAAVFLLMRLILQIIFLYPGAFIRWIFTGCRNSFKETLKNGSAFIDGSIGFILFLLILVICLNV